MSFKSIPFLVGEEVVLAERVRALRDMGYERQEKVDIAGSFSKRGGVLDVFPWAYSFPIRIEFDSDRVESIYTFDPASGKLLEHHQMMVVLPVSGRNLRLKARTIADWQWGEKPIQPFVDVERGEHVVHIAHGIAIFRGMRQMAHEGREGMHMVLEFANKERLYIPAEQLHLVQRYVAVGQKLSHSKLTALSKLGSKNWIRIREKARKAIYSYAHELLQVQAKRQLIKGHAFAKDSDWQDQLEQSFPYMDTPDQIKAAREIKCDMEAVRPMDRLICGDVGYGKTEVALRAAFKCIMDKRQVAMLVPTTILAEQHYETFSERFKPFGVEIAMMSRFQTKAEQRQTVQRMAAGKCDLVIGTHRLLSNDIAFYDLGLLIIDEEQRFGVRHKERLKKFRLVVDVLTLTATPIPRTLYLSLVGGKDMSVIQTPPQNRIPIQTQVVSSHEKTIREGIRRELERKGQVFFVHNRIFDIHRVAANLDKIVPEARIAVAHGQMNGKELERVMHRFIHHEIDVLVSTTIVESGIDIPNANTLFVDEADRFGLSELYQLRGRVGRFNREAYAYFLISKKASLTHDSQRRLDAIVKHQHLGAGFNIAMEDLEIRGAGNLLGTEQTGFITAVGFDLYCRLLKDAIDRIQNKRSSD